MTVEYPESVDLVVLGTGLVQAIISCAAARQGKSVLIVDPNTFYGEAGATLNLQEFQSWLRSQAQNQNIQEHTDHDATAKLDLESKEPTEVPLPIKTCSRIRAVDTWFKQEDKESRSKFCIDLAHQALESLGPCVQGIRDIGLHNYLEFSAVTSAHTLHQGRLCGIPANRADVHGASWLSAEGKRTLNLFLSAAQQAAAGSASEIFQTSHFKAAMEEFGLPESVQDGILYSVYSAETKITSTTAVDGSKVLEAMVKYMSQSGVYVAGQAPFIELHYGSGEVSQAFVRNCCVFGGHVALGVRASSVSVQDGAVTGITLDNGHHLTCKALVGSFEYMSHLQQSTSLKNSAAEGAKSMDSSGSHPEPAMDPPGGKSVARAIVAVSRPVLEHLTNCKIMIPPGECGNARAVTVWQCHDTLHSCPKGSVLLYFSVSADAASDAKELLQSCVVSLLATASKEDASVQTANDAPPDAAAADGELLDNLSPTEADVARTTVQDFPEVTFACYFIQGLPDASLLQLPAGVACCGDVGASSEMDVPFLEAEEIFSKLFPDVVFLTKAPAVGTEASKGEEEQGDDLDNALKALGLV